MAALAPYRPNTRQRMRVVGSVPAANGTQQQITFPQVGFMGRIFLFANTTISDAAAGPSVAASTFGPFNLLKRLIGITNLGTSTIFELSGFGCYLLSKICSAVGDFKAANPDVTTDVFFQYPTSGFVQNTPKAVTFCLIIPVSANDYDQFHIGLIPLQAPEVRFTLQINFSGTPGATAGSIADVYVTGDTLTIGGNVNIYYQYYEVANPDAVELPPRVMHRCLEDQVPVVAGGDNVYLLPRQGILLQLISTLVYGGAVDKTSNVNTTARRLVFNETDTPYSFDYIVDRILNRFRYGLPGTSVELPGGVYVWDFFTANGLPSYGDLRDAVDTEALSSLKSFMTLSTGAPPANSFIQVIRRISQQY